MNKKEFVEKLHGEVKGFSKISKNELERIVSKLFDVITDEVINGEEVIIKNFGKFYKATRAERKGLNPKTLEEIKIPERKALKFRASRGLKTL